MILLMGGTTDLVSVISSVAGSLSVMASYMDMTNADPPVVKGSTSGSQITQITTAATVTIVAAPAGSDRRNVEEISIRNNHATLSNDVTVQMNRSAGTLTEIIKMTIPVGSTLQYTIATGWFLIANGAKLDTKLRVAADVVFATAATFADITGLTCNVISGRQYCFESHLYHFGNATTTGAQFGIGGVTMTAMRIQQLDVILSSLTAATMGSNVADVTAVNTAAAAETTGQATTPVLAILSGWFNPSASGVFAIRGTSEVTVAAGLTIKQGSWARVWESDN